MFSLLRSYLPHYRSKKTRGQSSNRRSTLRSFTGTSRSVQEAPTPKVVSVNKPVVNKKLPSEVEVMKTTPANLPETVKSGETLKPAEDTSKSTQQAVVLEKKKSRKRSKSKGKVTKKRATKKTGKGKTKRRKMSR
jgi:hypothetical protein